MAKKEKKNGRKKEVQKKESETTSKKTLTAFKNRPLLIGIGVAALFLLFVAIVGAVIWKNKTAITSEALSTVEEIKKKTKGKKEEPPLTQPRRIDGIVVATSDANKVPACVMIENAAFSGVRPQSGLSSASVVYEVIVEGGITRLMAVFAGEQADPVGPVRSARDTYLEFASEYNCAYVHAGGSYTAVTALPRLGMRYIDALREAKWFWRDSTKYSPHNLFTNTNNLYEAITQGHSWTQEPTYESWKFVTDEKIPFGETVKEVNVRFGGSYDVTYTYNSDGKHYDRLNGGQAHADANTGKQLTVRNIIVQHVPVGDFIEGKGRVNFGVTGEGVVEIFRNGVVTKGTWKKTDRLDRTRFYDESGEQIALVRGNSWVEIVPEGYSVDWK